MQVTPSVERARPSRCPCCGAAGWPVGEHCNLHGSGVRERQVQGVLEPGEPPSSSAIWVRRYHCQRCRAWLTVVPRGVIAKRTYFGGAIGFALALFGVERRSAADVRKQVSDASRLGATAATGWAQLRRWIRDVRDGRLFVPVRGPPDGWALRRIAERAAMTLAAYAEARTDGAAPAVQAWLGAQTALAMPVGP